MIAGARPRDRRFESCEGSVEREREVDVVHWSGRRRPGISSRERLTPHRHQVLAIESDHSRLSSNYLTRRKVCDRARRRWVGRPKLCLQRARDDQERDAAPRL